MYFRENTPDPNQPNGIALETLDNFVKSCGM